jgi:hypothetical protein
VLGPRWEILAWNRAQARLFPTLERLAPAERNLLWVMFALREVRALFVDWEEEADRLVTQFRADTERLVSDEPWRKLVAELEARSPEFAARWSRHEVAPFESRLRRYDHPRAGRVVFEYQQLVPAGFPHLRVVVHLPIPDDDSAARLAAWHEV